MHKFFKTYQCVFTTWNTRKFKRSIFLRFCLAQCLSFSLLGNLFQNSRLNWITAADILSEENIISNHNMDVHHFVHVYFNLCMCISICAYVFQFVRVYFNLCMCISICACVFQFVRVYFNLCMCISICACLFQFVRVYFNLCMCISICACVFQFVHVYFNSCVCISFCACVFQFVRVYFNLYVFALLYHRTSFISAKNARHEVHSPLHCIHFEIYIVFLTRKNTPELA